ncbi:DUF4369 domain-containing protein [uncultured Porphyromonas sp.]|uniref:DUF4369 domain-containing protein n=1 Tax=uncultured Porphyromonas sp. TaxID=159274 RepID=UPI00262DF50E|nr:DUF4369 domain-containing protein [uncultured Porphyromonas sp.]
MSHKTLFTSHIATLFMGLLVILPSCSGEGNKFRIQGTITGAVGKTLFLEHQGLTAIEPIDSVVLDERGKYKMGGEAPEYPEFYRLRLEKQVIPFSVDSIETITINSDAQSFATGYTVEGSIPAEKIKHVWLAQLDANVAMSQLVQKYDAGKISYVDFASHRDSILQSYKDVAQEVIFEDPKSPVAYFALFQQIDGNLIFNIYDKKDSRIFAAVANVYDTFYPESERRDHLYNLALRSIAVVRQQEKAAREIAKVDSLSRPEVHRIGYFDISLPNIDGKEVRLSEVAKDHMTLLSFTTMDTDWSVAYQSQISSLYQTYTGRGLRIYQVSFDGDSYVWKNRVAQQPWHNVRDADGVYSSLIGLYNIGSLPALFLINAQGDIVARASSFDELRSLIDKQL